MSKNVIPNLEKFFKKKEIKREINPNYFLTFTVPFTLLVMYLA